MKFKITQLTLLITLLLLIASTVIGQETDKLIKDIKWRSIGPANYSGRIVDVEAIEGDFSRLFVASASGGVWKSDNAGITWAPIFDNYASASIGDIKIFQKNPDIIWVGTGEANNRNSVAWGDGIYKSTDGGDTFKNMGLEKTKQIARIITDPNDPDVVYVAAIGSLWGYSGERGLFKTTNGGKNWKEVKGGLPENIEAGAIDLAMDPRDPNTLFVAFYERLRKPWRFDSGGPNGGIFKSTDGGKSWKKLTNGLPAGDTGRIGIDIHRSNPDIMVAIIEHGNQPAEGTPEYEDMTNLGTGIYRSEDGGESWKQVNRYNNRPFYYSQIRINPIDDQRIYVLTTSFRQSFDGGKTFDAAPLSFEGGLDNHAMWLDPEDKDRYWLGKDKGLTLTYDHGDNFILFDNLALGQYYSIGVDMRDPYYVYGGTQDNGTWGGPSFSKDVRGILNDSNWKLHWGDGMFIQVDPTNYRKVYTEAEGASFRRYDPVTRREQRAKPAPDNVINMEVYEGETFRFNWRSPLVMSPHNPSTLFVGGNVLFKTVDEGYTWKIISPDLSTQAPEKLSRENMGGLTREGSGAEMHCAITSFSESPIIPGMYWVGTDDGNVHISMNDGVNWTAVRANIKGVPDAMWVSDIEASNHNKGTAYITFDGHRSDIYEPWIYKTTDFGKSWKKIIKGIPKRDVMYTIIEDRVNSNLLFSGSEFAVYYSTNGGEKWARFMNNMPTVAIHDLLIHPRDNDLLAGTHGRAIWIADDISPLQKLTDEVADADVYLFDQKVATIWEDKTRGGVRGQFFFAGENPWNLPRRDDIVRQKIFNGAHITYYLKDDAKDVSLTISSIDGTKTANLKGTGDAGINRVQWGFMYKIGDQTRESYIAEFMTRIERMAAASGRSDMVGQIKEMLANVQFDDELIVLVNQIRDYLGRGGRGLPRFGAPAEPGVYRLTLNVDGTEYTKTLTVRSDPEVHIRELR